FAAAQRGSARAPRQLIEAARNTAVGVPVSQAVERAPRPRCAVGPGFTHPFDLPDLHRRRAARIRHDAIFDIGVGQLDRLAALRAGHGSSASSGANPTGSIAFAGSTTGAGSEGPSA